MKADKNFRMAKTTKTLMALLPFKNQEDRNSFKRAMIDAQLAAEAATTDWPDSLPTTSAQRRTPVSRRRSSSNPPDRPANQLRSSGV